MEGGGEMQRRGDVPRYIIEGDHKGGMEERPAEARPIQKGLGRARQKKRFSVSGESCVFKTQNRSVREKGDKKKGEGPERSSRVLGLKRFPRDWHRRFWHE